MRRLSAPLHGTLGPYLRDALQEGSAHGVACLPVSWAEVFVLFYSFHLLVSAAFSCKNISSI
jgi:CBS domain-containing protein